MGQGVQMRTQDGQPPAVGSRVTVASQDLNAPRPTGHPWTVRWAALRSDEQALNRFVADVRRFMHALHARYAGLVARQSPVDPKEKLRQAAKQFCYAFESEERRQTFADSIVIDGTLWIILLNASRLEMAAGDVGMFTECPQAKKRVVQ